MSEKLNQTATRPHLLDFIQCDFVHFGVDAVLAKQKVLEQHARHRARRRNRLVDRVEHGATLALTKHYTLHKHTQTFRAHRTYATHQLALFGHACNACLQVKRILDGRADARQILGDLQVRSLMLTSDQKHRRVSPQRDCAPARLPAACSRVGR